DDIAVFVEASQQTKLSRFHNFYAWKALTTAATDGLWASRIQDERPKIDLQRASADIVNNLEDAVL
ncbi:hypothetical protein ACCS75_35890, partial [Rhizobium ruizarguesonis]